MQKRELGSGSSVPCLLFSKDRLGVVNLLLSVLGSVSCE
jgi:hypothetical protein